MEPPVAKHSFLSNVLVRSFSFAVLIFVSRFAYIVTVRGGSCDSANFCFFPKNLNLRNTKLRANLSSSTNGSGDSFSDKNWGHSVEYYTTIFQDLITEGFLSPNSRAFCIDTPSGEDILTLKKVGIINSIGIFKKPSLPLIAHGDGCQKPFPRDS